MCKVQGNSHDPAVMWKKSKDELKYTVNGYLCCLSLLCTVNLGADSTNARSQTGNGVVLYLLGYSATWSEKWRAVTSLGQAGYIKYALFISVYFVIQF